MAGCCQHGSESSGYMKSGKCLDNVRNCLLIKRESTSQIYLHRSSDHNVKRVLIFKNICIRRFLKKHKNTAAFLSTNQQTLLLGRNVNTCKVQTKVYERLQHCAVNISRAFTLVAGSKLLLTLFVHNID